MYFDNDDNSVHAGEQGIMQSWLTYQL